VLLKETTSSTWMRWRAERFRVSGNEMPKRAEEALESARSRTSPPVKATSFSGRVGSSDLSWLPSRMVNTPSDIFTARERDLAMNLSSCAAPWLKVETALVSGLYKFCLALLFHFYMRSADDSLFFFLFFFFRKLKKKKTTRFKISSVSKIK
jgi:hypothetical protein